MRIIIVLLICCFTTAVAACAQTDPANTPCDGCEAIYEHPFDSLGWSTVVAPGGEAGTPLIVSGRVLQANGETPAAGVVVYIHHTNAAGIYPMRGDESGWARRHGYLRGWVKTNKRGEYGFETIRPAPYPGRNDPAHIHFTIKEPNRREYYIDDIVFADDRLVTQKYRADRTNRGGSGIVTPARDRSGRWTVQRDIVLLKR